MSPVLTADLSSEPTGIVGSFGFLSTAQTRGNITARVCEHGITNNINRITDH
jgi:hypothetical protein